MFLPCKKIKLLLTLQLFVSACAWAQPIGWVSLPKPVNGFVNDLVVYKGHMIAAGSFKTAGEDTVNKIAAWDGANWYSLGAGFPHSTATIQTLFEFNQELYAGGSFTNAGGVIAKNIARWNGTSWSGFSGACNGTVFSMVMYNNELYASGNFTTIDGIAANRIAKWNGTSWQNIGSGIATTAIGGLCVYNNNLYASGIDSVNGAYAGKIAKWNGSTWTGIGNSNTGGWALFVWQGKLLFGSHPKPAQNPSGYTTVIDQWDGSNWTLFSDQEMMETFKFTVFNYRLYTSGGSSFGAPYGASYVMSWNPVTAKWNAIGLGVNRYVVALCEYKSELYCGGWFNYANYGYHNYLARLNGIVGVEENPGDDLNMSVYPNPVKDRLNIVSEKETTSLVTATLTNMLGQKVRELSRSDIDGSIDVSALQNGVYYLRIYSGKSVETLKIIKE